MNYYLAQKEKLLKGHQQMMELARPYLTERYGAELADTAVAQSTIEFEQLIPEIPYIGGKANSMTDTLVQMATLLALYRVLKRQGKPVAEIGQLAQEMAQAWVDQYPQFLRRLIGRYYFSAFNRRRLAQKADTLRQQQYPGDFVREVVEGGPDDDFAWGVNYLECGVVKFFAAQDAAEFSPFMCEIDYLIFPALSIDLQRTGTIAQGCSHCDFRFRQKRKKSDFSKKSDF
ncbi:MAG TPA: L-2-amino-thiazoline-4-carboxylic acid hydrolase [Chloroflexota bacterium]|nr:L-2-amino-thiazoline-4-carboxylic acid hydrolase [Chloroflexota bacterium]